MRAKIRFKVATGKTKSLEAPTFFQAFMQWDQLPVDESRFAGFVIVPKRDLAGSTWMALVAPFNKTGSQDEQDLTRQSQNKILSIL